MNYVNTRYVSLPLPHSKNVPVPEQFSFSNSQVTRTISNAKSSHNTDITYEPGESNEMIRVTKESLDNIIRKLGLSKKGSWNLDVGLRNVIFYEKT